MKKFIVISLVLGGIAGATYVSASNSSNGMHECDGQNRFVSELNLDSERAAKMQEVIGSYRAVGKLYLSGQADAIPQFLAEKEAELAAILTPEELAQFKQSVGDWMKTKNFNFMKFAGGKNIPQSDRSSQL